MTIEYHPCYICCTQKFRKMDRLKAINLTANLREQAEALRCSCFCRDRSGTAYDLRIREDSGTDACREEAPETKIG